MGYNGNYISDTDITWPSGISAAEKQEIIETAEAVLEHALAWRPRFSHFDIRMDGNSKNRIILPLRERIIEVSDVYVNAQKLEPTWWTHDLCSVYLDAWSSNAALPSDPELDRLLSERDGGIFVRGYNNIRIVGTCGVSAVPAWARRAVRMIVDAMNDPTAYTIYHTGGETIGRYSYNSPAGACKTGIREVDELLKLFVRKKPILMAP